jgi:hypothetical protein
MNHPVVPSCLSAARGMLLLMLMLMPMPMLLLHRDPSPQRLMAMTKATCYLLGTGYRGQAAKQSTASKTCKSRKLPPVGAPAAC